MSDKFCALACVHRFINIGGEIQVCCSSEEQDNNIVSSGTSEGAIMNSEFMKTLRRTMLDGRWPKLCERCRVTEKLGGVSRRMDENLHFKGIIDELIRSTKSDGTIPIKIRSADYRLGNLCNLACRMCNAASSSRWSRIWKGTALRSSVASHRVFNWYRIPRFFTSFKTQVPTLDYLHFGGGEPLIVPEMLKMLRYCVKTGHARRINLSYNTNITKIPAAAKALWPHFQKVRLFCSVDGYGPINDLIRHPSSWKMIDKNLRDLDKNFEEYGLSEVILMTTVQIYNVFCLEELYDYLAENMKNVCQLPKLIDLYCPMHYRTQILPPSLKKKARRKLESLLSKSQERIRRGMISQAHAACLPSIQGAINFMMLEDHQAEISAFQAETATMDGITRRDVYELVPELRELRP